jgi:hypothetical protein
MILPFKFNTFIILAFFSIFQTYEAKFIKRGQYNLNNINPCIENLTYSINLTEIVLNPYPIVNGKTLGTTLIGSSMTTIQPGSSVYFLYHMMGI